MQSISGRLPRATVVCLIAIAACMVPSGAAFAQQSTENYKYDVLGRLVAVETAGGQNDEEVHSLCYDAAGNRVEFKATSDGTEAACVSQGIADGGSGGGGGDPPPPPPPPPPSNNPPVTTSDSSSGPCFTLKTVNLTVNDSDPEGHYPLTLLSISQTSGLASASIASGSTSSVWVDFGPEFDVSTFAYTVADSLGATSAGLLTLTTTSCNGGSEP